MNLPRSGHKRTLALLFLLASGMAQSASFDCAKARSDTEKRICADPAVSRLDSELALVYRDTMAGVAHKGALKGWQKQWLWSTRDDCADAACLGLAYAARIAELRGHTRAGAAAGGVSGRYERHYRNKPDKTATIDVFALPGNRVRVLGSAHWQSANPDNVNIGDISGVATLDKKVLRYRDGNGDREGEIGCMLTLTFAGDALTVSDDNRRCGGHNVTFDGAYRRASGSK
ncbi:lysozyme inhibitor LprI family protein [Massilia glaciei]|uniref:DUF1311 domain-containing protein n=1 Tax=Massilia glaciei TaxID=1524097 RepID=A0A2U2I5N7_9BURK|nr:hypothetical protein [Massilia glaciei]PWF55032.1 hypothetical protein C7C56_003890 [Massilia glaciei]